MIPFALLALTFAAYGLFFWQLGFYWDDLGMSWIRYQFGTEAMRVYFSTSRPVWGILFQFTTRLIPQIPAYWQLFALFWRWVTVILCWILFRDLWPGRRQLALIVSLFFLVYPGFDLQWVSYVSSHFFIVLAFFLFSYLLMLWSFRNPAYYWGLTVIGMFFSALNLWMLEYFFFLELVRPFFIFAFLTEDPATAKSKPGHLLLMASKKWLPYLAIWLANVFYRSLVFTNLSHQNLLLTDLRTQPLITGLALVKSIFSDLWLVSVQAWTLVFHFPIPSADGLLTTLMYAAVFLVVGLITGFLLIRIGDDDQNLVLSLKVLVPLALGFMMMLLGGGPYWLAKVDLSLGFPATRFTLSFMLGVSLFLAALLELFPARIRILIVVVLVALGAGRQAWWADSFRRDWITQKSMFWQMFWRAPGLSQNTMVLMNQGSLDYYADNSLGASLNWIYDPNNQSTQMHYVLFFPTSRLGGSSLPDLRPGFDIIYNYWVGNFVGNTSKVVAFYYRPPGCLRLLDPEIDSQNHLIPDASLMRDAAKLSSSAWITPIQTASMPQVYGPEPVHGWCYYFEQADLARQVGDWQKIVKLGELAFNLNDHPNDPVERFVFIEAYAHVGDWTEMKEQAFTSYKISPNYIGPLLCKLLTRIDREVPFSIDKQSSLNDLRTRFSCLP